MWGVRTHRGAPAAAVTAPWLCLKDEQPTGRQAPIGSGEQSDHAHIAQMQVNPFGHAETYDDIILTPTRPLVLR